MWKRVGHQKNQNLIRSLEFQHHFYPLGGTEGLVTELITDQIYVMKSPQKSINYEAQRASGLKNISMCGKDGVS